MSLDQPAHRRPRVAAAVLAGGVGSRMGSAHPKQLLRLAGQTILERSVAALCAAPEVDEVVVVMNAAHLAEAEKILAEGRYDKVSRIVPGGASRSESSLAALQAVDDYDDNDLLLLHDAARPLVSGRTITACVTELTEVGAVGVAVPSSDTVVQVTLDVSGREVIAAVPDRAALRRMQTPQGFRLGVIRRAYARAFADPGFTATDDCGVVLRYLPEEPVRIVTGEESNIKVTHPSDLAVAEALLRTGVAQ
ncbi:2-C-methyl-D-erythritol 4-phosphate cytidylyltransferase [Thermobifida fusca]|uniref:IspD/TarI family cytidylyltransferase n=1 Tax=Thermobifida fusca TaxID=2021 RepID=UPI00156B8D65|nr:IspD/TarI family cytidylyltransferase [Thermobifida fusca]